MSVPTATISSPTRAGDGAQRAAARVAVDRADVADAAGAERRGRRASSAGTRSTARSRTGSNATTVASYSCAVDVFDRGRRPPPRRRGRWSRRGRSSATQPLPSWIWRHARPLTFTIDLRTVRVDRGRDHGLGRAPGIGRVVERAERRGVRRVGDRAAPRRELGGLRRARASSMNATTAEPRAMRAGQPLAVASDGIVIQTSSEHAERADRRARDAVPAGQRRAVAAERGAR